MTLELYQWIQTEQQIIELPAIRRADEKRQSVPGVPPTTA